MSVYSWADLPVTVFDRIFVDGFTAAQMTAVCSTWRKRVLQIPRMKQLIDARFQDLTKLDAEVFCRAISKNHTKLKLISGKSALDAISAHGLSMDVDVKQLIPYLNRYLEQASLSTKPKGIQDLLDSIGYFGEGVRVFKDPNTGDIIVANDFYAARESLFYNNDMSFGNERLEPFRMLEKLLPGIFVWKVIRTHVREFGSVLVGKRDYHRDTCVLLRFKTLRGRGLFRLNPKILTDAEISAIVTIRDHSDKVVKKKKIERYFW